MLCRPAGAPSATRYAVLASANAPADDGGRWLGGALERHARRLDAGLGRAPSCSPRRRCCYSAAFSCGRYFLAGGQVFGTTRACCGISGTSAPSRQAA